MERWKSIASIASSIAIPIVLAIVGYFIQKQLADEGLKKDYVSIAAGILKENPVNQEPELRKWAVTMLDSNSPIPFSGRAKAGLEKGIFLAVAPPRIPNAPEGCMSAPRPAKIGPFVRRLAKKKQYSSAEEMAKDYDQLWLVAVKAEAEAMEDRASLECLQKYSKLVAQWTQETAEMYAKPIDQWPTAKPKNE
ncbi:MAG: hypothetical protein HZC22_14370 [Rhodocyclales bacterium]|nr:hypothetical protein [Rhodocyclales bacterium]